MIRRRLVGLMASLAVIAIVIGMPILLLKWVERSRLRYPPRPRCGDGCPDNDGTITGRDHHRQLARVGTPR